MKKLVRNLGFALFGFILLALLAIYLIYPAQYVNRVLRWRKSDVYDYQKFPARPMEAADTPLPFDRQLAEDAVINEFEAIAEVEDFEAWLAKNRTQAFIVIQDNAILYEGYFNGASLQSIVTSFSTAKSFTSALIGIAIDEGHIHDVSDPITEYLPELLERDRAFSDITIRDLLMMSSGIRYAEPPDDISTYYYPDLRTLALHETRITGEPGAQFHYNNFHPLLLGLILERATGVHVAEYLESKIWKPMGAEYPGSWSMDENGFEKMESGINGRAIDFAKFGRLFLNQGSTAGVQIVPEAWVLESTRPDTNLNYASYYPDDSVFFYGDGYYKYMWWGIRRDAQNVDFMALGNYGQIIYISPMKDLILVRFGESYGEFDSAGGWVNLLYRFSTAW